MSDETKELADLLKRLAQEPKDAQYAEKMGYDAALHGPNQTNCHFSLFGRPELTKAWERGRARGMSDHNEAIDRKVSKQRT